MRLRNWTTFALAAALVTLLGVPAAEAQFRRDRNDNWQRTVGSEAFERGYRQGIRSGERDARDGRDSDFRRDREYRDADQGYDRRWGTRDEYRNVFRRGFAEGYRDGFQRSARGGANRPGNDRRFGATQEPASARGYSDGYEKGLEDRNDRDRYDPVRHGDYRDADDGYYREYGPKDAYKNNYRAGFRQGYDEGYRDGARRR